MSTRYEEKRIDINLLDVNKENPRFQSVESHRKAMLEIVKNQQMSGGSNKLLNIAKHILTKGLNPNDIPYVTPNREDKGHYTVLEGNRRVTALRLLREPAIIEKEYKGLAGKFRDLVKGINLSHFDKILCRVYPNPDDAKVWIELKHTGENDGVGIDSWDYEQQQRYKGSGPITEIIDYVKNSDSFDSETKEKMSKVKYTNFERLIRDPNWKSFLGLKVEKNKCYSEYPVEEFNKGISTVVDIIGADDFKVTNIYYKEDRTALLKSIPEKDRPKQDIVKEWKLTDPPPATKGGKKTPKKPKRKKDLPKSTDRKNLIPESTVVIIGEVKPHNIYLELKSLNVDEYFNAIGVLFRVFLELSIDFYISNNPIITKRDDRLKDKIKKVCNYMQLNKIMSNDDLKGPRELAAGTQGYLSVNTFNAYVHNKKYSPTPLDLKIKWENLEGFILKVWNN